MSRILMVALIVAIALTASTAVVANDYLVGGMFNTPHVTHYRTVPTGQVAYYAPTAVQQTSCCQPTAQPTFVQPGGGQVAYYPQTAYYPQVAVAPQMPVTAYRPVAVAAVPRPVVAARPVVVRSRYYVVGQPIRNVGRWILPGVPSVIAAPQGVAYPLGY